MPFSSLPNFSSVDVLQQEVISTTKIPQRLLSVLSALAIWQQLLTESDSSNRLALRTYAKQLGYLGRTSFVSLAEKPESVSSFSDNFIKALTSGKLSIESLDTIKQSALKTLCGEVSFGQLKLLKSIIAQQSALDNLSIGKLPTIFPFPITQYNYFGRFIASGGSNPDQAISHLHISMPFFVRMRALLDQLTSKKYNILELGVFSFEEETQAANPLRPEKKLTAHKTNSSTKEILALVKVCVERSKDLLAHPSNGKYDHLVLIEIPELPNTISYDHIDEKDQPKLAAAVLDWVFFGRLESPILHSIEPNHIQKQLLARVSRRLEKLTNTIGEHSSAEPPKENKKAWASWRAGLENIKADRSNNSKRLLELSAEKDKIVSVASQLGAFKINRHQVAAFRKKISNALKNGDKIVFSSSDSSHRLFIKLYAKTLGKKALEQHPAVQLLKASKLLLSESQAANFKRAVNVVPEKTGFREFKINSDEYNASVKHILSSFLPDKADPKISSLLECIINNIELPGVESPTHLRVLVQEKSGRASPNINNYLTYVFENSATLDQSGLLSLLKAVKHLGVNRLPNRCIELATERFGIDSKVLNLFEVFSKNYRPQTVGELPEIFENLALFESYLALGLDAFGMQPEVDLLQQLLNKHQIVQIIDGTSYHPELDTTIAATGGKLKKGDTEQTEEVWGEYITPPERLLRAFARRVMEGKVDDVLQHHTIVAVKKPTKQDRVVQSIIKKFYGIDLDISPSISKINSLLSDLKVFCANTVLVVETGTINNLESYREFVELLSKYQLKIILRTREALPGIAQVNIQPFLEKQIAERLHAETESMSMRLGLSTPITRAVIEFATLQVVSTRKPGDDPLNLTLQVLNSAASSARMYGDRKVHKQDVAAAIPAIFHLPDTQQMRLRIAAIDDFAKRAPLEVLGQAKAIQQIANLIKSHILGIRDAQRPLTLLIPGPTGVGKTELMLRFANICDIPFLSIEGAEFAEEHTISRLVGSPSGYAGPDEGVLYSFLKDNSAGMVFIDEIEKMHPAVWIALMNFYDKGTVTGGHGKSVSRPGLIIVGASNAGADQLNRELDEVQIRSILAEAFVDRFGRPRPELVRRFLPIPMLAIQEDDFKSVISTNLNSIDRRKGFVDANLSLASIDDSAIKLIFAEAKKVCEYDEEALSGTRRMGLPTGETTQKQSDLYYDMRYVGRAIDELVGDSLRTIVLEQMSSGAGQKRGEQRRVKFVGDMQLKKILVVDTNN